MRGGRKGRFNCIIIKVNDDDNDLALFVQRLDNFIQRIKCISWSTFYPLDSDLSPQ